MTVSGISDYRSLISSENSTSDLPTPTTTLGFPRPTTFGFPRPKPLLSTPTF
ncbi:hypothetical protein Fleli_0493 [Bernardetia litoralis DSM 6794]|uniref:Uncharacterized protein n=2 Tax=Bernardetia litoralis TaxID=999 RepID=I4AG83_BERLS|nr:hypothetical protein Fleli_0493 [Bernardetia litoralis DSM 6794]